MAQPRRDAGQVRIAVAARAVSQAFWALAAGVVVAYVFFLALGAFGTGELTGVTVAVVVLAALWVVRTVRASRRHARDPAASHDPRVIRARERRGF